MNKALNRISTLLMLMLSVIPMVHLLISSFGLEADQRLPLFLMAAVFFCWLLFSFVPYTLPGLLISGLLAVFMFFGRRQELSQQFTDILDRIAVTYYQRFASATAELASTVPNHTEALLMLGFILAALLAMALNSKEDRAFLATLISLPPIFMCLLVFGYIPGWIMLCLSLFMALLLICGQAPGADNNSGRSFFVFILPVALFFTVLLFFKGPEHYDYNRQFSSPVQLVQEYSRSLFGFLRGNGDDGSEVNERLPAESGDENSNGVSANQWDSSAGTLDASAETGQDELDQLLMYVTADRDGRIYLRHNSYGSYTGKGWGQAPTYPGGSVPAFISAAVEQSGEAEKASFSIRLVSADASMRYIPYYSMEEYDRDSYISGADGEYSGEYLSYAGSYEALTLPARLKDRELSYRQYVHGNYLSLPGSTREALSALAEENRLIGENVFDSISLVADYVKSSADYNIETQPYPSDDYALYLLTEAEEGYCVHFATAAAAMYRAINIPARVVTGAAADAAAGQAVEILRKNEHAWVEVYIDGLGWLPVEVTPGSISSPDGSGSGEESPEPEETDSPEASPSPVPEAESQEADKPGAATVRPESSTAALAVLLVFIGLFSLTGLFCLWYFIRRIMWRRRLAAADDAAAINIWRCARDICAFAAEVPGLIEVNAQKAFYGRGLDSKEELDKGRRELEVLRNRVYVKLPWYKKFVFKYIRGLK